MIDILRILIQFVFRVTFGLALAMGVTSPRLVTSGYFQKHLWVLMGLNTVAALAAFSSRSLGASWASPAIVWLGGFLSFACYAGSVLWLYESRQWGRRLLFVVAGIGLLAAVVATATPNAPRPLTSDARRLPASADANASDSRLADTLAADTLAADKLAADTLAADTLAAGSQATAGPANWWRLVVAADVASGGLVLGATLAAMFLGHWYLNTPTMELRPLRRLLLLMLAAVAVRAVFAAGSTGLRMYSSDEAIATQFWLFLTLRWLAGIVGVFGMGWMAWETLRIPNTQSATGVLYAGVILSFIGELVAQLLSAGQFFPV